jgi:two-component system, response regulator YesN
MRSDMLSLFRQLVEAQKVNFTILEPPYDNIEHFDLGLRKTIYQDYSFTPFIDFLTTQSKKLILYHYTDTYHCNYSFFRLNTEDVEKPSYVIIGPYLGEEISSAQFRLIQEKISLPISLENEFREYLNAVTVFAELSHFHSMLSIMAAHTLDRPQTLTIKFLNPFDEMSLEQLGYRLDATPVISSKMIENRYKAENQLLMDIAQGNAAKAQISFHNFLQFHITPRFKDPVRNIKNLTIVLNTLLRKAVESSDVHPIHIDEVSRGFAMRIEAVHSLKEMDELQTAMIRKYCMLVTNHSLTGYSPLIQRVINHIDMNLTESLSLRILSDQFSINSSYLSTIFKKEMGITITEYINQQKVRFAITLLNKTDTQIQNIASQVGIDDVNYFIKVFKKINGMTPKEYRDSIKGQREL